MAMSAVCVVLALVGCTVASAVPADGKPNPIATRDGQDAASRQNIGSVCAVATEINTLVNDADWRYTSEHSITSDEWLASLLDAKQRAGRLAKSVTMEPISAAAAQYSEMIIGFDEAPPAEPPSRDWETPTLLVDACNDAATSYGVSGGGAVGG